MMRFIDYARHVCGFPSRAEDKQMRWGGRCDGRSWLRAVAVAGAGAGGEGRPTNKQQTQHHVICPAGRAVTWCWCPFSLCLALQA